MNMFKTYWWEGPSLGILFGAVLIIASLLAPVACSSVACDDLAEVTGRRTEYRILSGCYVEVDGRMIPRDSWRGEQSR